MAFSNNLRQLLKERNMRAVDLARQTGISEASISDYLNGKKEPRGKQSIEIARALHISLDVLWETEYQMSTIVEKDKALSLTETQHLKKYRRLNDDGKEKLDGYMDDLLTIEKYSTTVRKIEKPILLAGAARTNDGNYDRDNSLTMEEQKELLKKLREVPGLSSDKEI